jgi:D-lyxose ketol-isomerase
MKRSEINYLINDGIIFMKEHGFHLPPFAYWTPMNWENKGLEVKEIVDRALGWDITDFGSGDYSKVGLLIFTIRNGDPQNLKAGEGKLYAEKILLADEDQVTPMHFHWNKMEDIINRGGAKLMIQVFNSATDESLDEESDVEVNLDGVIKKVPAGTILELLPGESISIPQGLYHKFWGGGGRVLIGEVSLVNDDNTDNRFLKPTGRFPEIEEDESPLYPLCNEYHKYFKYL